MVHWQGSLENLAVTPEFWRNRRVLVTGHTGFKGAWLSLWLAQLGARVTGLAHDPETDPNLWALLNLSEVRHVVGDVCDGALLRQIMAEERPEIVLHLAAQSLVRPSYRDPVETFRTNVLGTVELLHAVSQADSVQAVLIVTSDKCYENPETDVPFTETDRMGGRDPYSASKGCAELATASMRASFFAPYATSGHSARVASARAGNVIGGGDWCEDRLVPDIIRGCLGQTGEVVLRSPGAVRPWQHVLDPLNGYLTLAENLFEGTPAADDGWNFGPDPTDERSVGNLAEAIVASLGRGKILTDTARATVHEAHYLRLDSSKARSLGWQPVWAFEEAVAKTAEWYGGWAENRNPRELTEMQIAEFTRQMTSRRA